MVCMECGSRIRTSSQKVFQSCRFSTPEDRECCRLGNKLRAESCKSCQSVMAEVHIYACEIHGECTIHNIAKRKPDGTRWQACSTCADRKTFP